MGLLLSLAFAGLVVVRPLPLIHIEYFGYDFLLRSLRRSLPVSDVVIVDVDETSLEELGQWPWPRYQVAELLTKIRDGEARSIGIDFLWSEPDRLSLSRVRQALSEYRGVSITLEGVPPESLDNDAILAKAVASAPAVVGVYLTFNEATVSSRPSSPTLGFPSVVFRRIHGDFEGSFLPIATGLTPPTPLIAAAATSSFGFLNALPDSDGKTRRAPLLMECPGGVCPSLALATFMRAVQAKSIIANISAAGLEEIQIGDTIVPTDRQGNMLLPFASSPESCFPSIPAADVIRNRVPLSLFQGKVVLLGSSAAGLGDMHATPLARRQSGLYVHAVVTDALLRNGFLHRPAWDYGFQVLAVCLTTLVATLLLARLRLAICAVGVAAGLVLLWIAAWWLLAYHGLYLSPTPAMLAMGSSFVILGVIRFGSEEGRAIRNALDLARAQDCAIAGLVSVVETRDPETGHHVVRTQHYVRILAERLAGHPRFRDELTPENIETICKSASLHDIGKVGIPDSILLKPAKLEPDEFKIMKEHAARGYQTLQRAEEISGAGEHNAFLRYACKIAFSHHEKWDGTGYPQGLSGEAIPIAARLMALADVYDALRCARHYKPPFPHERAVGIIAQESGAHFDPEIVRAFLDSEQIFLEIAEKYPDEPLSTD